MAPQSLDRAVALPLPRAPRHRMKARMLALKPALDRTAAPPIPEAKAWDRGL